MSKTNTETCKTSKATLKKRKDYLLFNFLLNHTGFTGFTCFCNGFTHGVNGFTHFLTKVRHVLQLSAKKVLFL